MLNKENGIYYYTETLIRVYKIKGLINYINSQRNK